MIGPDLSRLIILAFSSHRARDRAEVHGRGIALYSFRRGSYGYYAVTPEIAAEILARKIPGVTRLRKPYDDLRQCWG